MAHKASKWQGQNSTQDDVTPREQDSFPRACYYHDPNLIGAAHVSTAHHSLPILADIEVLEFKKPKYLGKNGILHKHSSINSILIGWH